jgi:hypothetical protein
MTKRVVQEETVFLSTEGEIGKLLCNLYKNIWVEACYDPYNEHTEKFAGNLLPDISRLNEILKFKP